MPGGDGWASPAETSPDVATLEPFAAGANPVPKLGRNQPCWCGSGRKYKACHLGTPERAPLPERVGWLCRKAMAYLQRAGPEATAAVAEHVGARASDPDDEDAVTEALADPLLFDTVLHASGWFDRFLAERGPLLPDDEAMLARTWTLSERSVFEVLDTAPGHRLTVRDLRTGDRTEIREQAFSRQATVGELVCARVVPDGVSAEGDPLLDCRADLEVADRAAARAELDRRYESDDEGWTWFGGADEHGGHRVLGWLQLADDMLTIRTMSEPRLDTAVAELRAALPEARVLRDERNPFEPSEVPAPSPAAGEIPAEALDELAGRFERRWCDERIPALGDYTPREAAADPTRREEVERLIASFPEIDPASGGFGLRPARLRELLGLDG